MLGAQVMCGWVRKWFWGRCASAIKSAQVAQKVAFQRASDSAQQILFSSRRKFDRMMNATNFTTSNDVLGGPDGLDGRASHGDVTSPATGIGSGEELLTLTEAAKCLPRIDGKKVSVCTIWRWCRNGLRGMFLEYARVGRRVCTSRAALRRFTVAVAQLDRRASPGGQPFPGSPARPSTSSRPFSFSSRRRSAISPRRQRELAAADAVLKRAGI